MKYVIVWASGKDLYTHSDPSGETILYTAEEIRQDEVPSYLHEVETIVESVGRVAVPVEALNRFLGVE